MAKITYNPSFGNYIVTFADGSSVRCHNEQTARFYARTCTTAPE